MIARLPSVTRADLPAAEGEFSSRLARRVVTYRAGHAVFRDPPRGTADASRNGQEVRHAGLPSNSLRHGLQLDVARRARRRLVPGPRHRRGGPRRERGARSPHPAVDGRGRGNGLRRAAPGVDFGRRASPQASPRRSPARGPRDLDGADGHARQRDPAGTSTTTPATSSSSARTATASCGDSCSAAWPTACSRARLAPRSSCRTAPSGPRWPTRNKPTSEGSRRPRSDASTGREPIVKGEYPVSQAWCSDTSRLE